MLDASHSQRDVDEKKFCDFGEPISENFRDGGLMGRQENGKVKFN